MYYIYLDKLLLPVTPSKLTIKTKNKNKTLIEINEGEINIFKKAGLTEIEFDAMIPNVKYPFAVYKNGFQNAKPFLEAIEKLNKQKPENIGQASRISGVSPADASVLAVWLEQQGRLNGKF